MMSVEESQIWTPKFMQALGGEICTVLCFQKALYLTGFTLALSVAEIFIELLGSRRRSLKKTPYRNLLEKVK